jgi:hypothetical protein
MNFDIPLAVFEYAHVRSEVCRKTGSMLVNVVSLFAPGIESKLRRRRHGHSAYVPLYILRCP